MRTMTLLLIYLGITSTSLAQNDARKKQFNLSHDVALGGYDPVSYFNSKPEEGDEDIATSHKGVTYYFVNRENLSKFKVNPEKYEPAYGGWCAYAMGETGEKVKVDPETFKIIEGRVYLFYNFWGNNTLEDWNKAEKKLKDSADRNWRNFVQ